MSLRFRCVHCQKALNTNPDRAGTFVSCPHCKKKSLVPNEGEAVPTRRWGRRLAALALLLLLVVGGFFLFREKETENDDGPAPTGPLHFVVADLSRERLVEEEPAKKAIMVGPMLLREKKKDVPVAAIQAKVPVEPAPLPAPPPKIRPKLTNPLLDARQKAAKEAKEKQERYDLALGLAKKALAQKDYGRAMQQFEEAGKIFQTADVFTGIHKAKSDSSAESAKIEAKQKKAAEAQRLAQRDADFNNLLNQAKKALEGNHFEQAILAYNQAKKFFPDDARVLSGLEQARRGQQEILAALKKADEEKKLLSQAGRDAEEEARKKNRAFLNSMQAGKLALANGDYKAAIDAFTEAEKIRPNDRAVLAGLNKALQAKINGAKTTPTTKPPPIDTTREKLDPNDPAPDLTKKKAEEKKKSAYRLSLLEGQQAFIKGNYETAIAAFTRAGKFFPNDREALAGLQKALQAREKMTVEAEQQRKEQERLALLEKAQREEEARQKAAAEAQLRDAAKKKADADAKLKAEIAQAAAKLKAESALKEQGEQRRKEALVGKHLAAGRTELNLKKFTEAEKAFSQAKNILPRAPAVVQAFKDLQQARQSYDLAKQKEAIQEAFGTLPLEGQTKTKFERHMADGNKHLSARRFTEAVREFQAALRLAPNNPTATAALKKAREQRP